MRSPLVAQGRQTPWTARSVSVESGNGSTQHMVFNRNMGDAMGTYSLWAPVVIMGGAIAGASQLPGGWCHAPWLSHFPDWQTAGHFLLYASLGFWVARSLSNFYGIRGAGLLILTGALCVSCAVVDEWHQTMVPDRSPEFWDIFVDWVGGIGGGFAYAVASWTLESPPSAKMGDLRRWGLKRAAVRISLVGLAVAVTYAVVVGTAPRVLHALPYWADRVEGMIPTRHPSMEPDLSRNEIRKDLPRRDTWTLPNFTESAWSTPAAAAAPAQPIPLAPEQQTGELGMLPSEVRTTKTGVRSSSQSSPSREPVHLEGTGGFVITREANPITDLSSEQLRKIFSGSLTNWRHLGGPDMPIHVLIGGKGGSDIFEGRLKTKATADAMKIAFAGLAVALVDHLPGAVGFVRVDGERRLRVIEKKGRLKRMRIVSGSGLRLKISSARR